MTQPEFQHSLVHANGIRFHVVQAGPADGAPVFLLHGFPDAWFGWRAQITALSGAGYRVIVPDGRGYNRSDKPEGVAQYRIDKLLGDLVGLADALGHSRFSVVGHDWGGILAWAAGSKLASRLDRLVILNAPHLEVVLPHALRSPTQMLRSSYVGFFQIPKLPEALLAKRNHALLARAMEKTSRPGTFSAEDLQAYREAWSQPGALTGMLNWYRALRLRPRMATRIAVPTLLLWGVQDQALELGLAERSLQWCDNGRLQTFPDATHWVQREEADGVNAAILDFLDN